jgi:hypothetical protein
MVPDGRGKHSIADEDDQGDQHEDTTYQCFGDFDGATAPRSRRGRNGVAGLLRLSLRPPCSEWR